MALTAKERNRAKAKRWYANNPDRARAVARAYYYRNLESMRAVAREYQRRRRAEDPGYGELQYIKYRQCAIRCATARNIMKRFGLTIEEYTRRLEAQGRKCFICRDELARGRGRFALDHDHATGAIRGFLCGRCNTGLGLFRDSPELLTRAALYVRGDS